MQVGGSNSLLTWCAWLNKFLNIGEWTTWLGRFSKWQKSATTISNWASLLQGVSLWLCHWDGIHLLFQCRSSCAHAKHDYSFLQHELWKNSSTPQALVEKLYKSWFYSNHCFREEKEVIDSSTVNVSVTLHKVGCHYLDQRKLIYIKWFHSFLGGNNKEGVPLDLRLAICLHDLDRFILDAFVLASNDFPLPAFACISEWKR